MGQNGEKRKHTIHRQKQRRGHAYEFGFVRRGAYKKEKRQGGGLSERRRRTETKNKNRRAGGWDRTERKASTPSTKRKTAQGARIRVWICSAWCLQEGKDVCSHGKQRAMALQLLGGVEAKDIPANVATFNSCISACAQGKQWRRALDLLHSMEDERVIPDVISYSSAIEACEKGNQRCHACFGPPGGNAKRNNPAQYHYVRLSHSCFDED